MCVCLPVCLSVCLYVCMYVCIRRCVFWSQVNMCGGADEFAAAFANVAASNKA